jgi:acyl carrier protein
MNRNHLLRLQRIFREIFDDPSIELTPEFSMESYGAWDSVATVQLMLATEEEFQCRLAPEVMGRIKTAGDLLAALPP